MKSTESDYPYDVFVSFRGKDTRYNFTDHLYAALQRNAIVAFKDDVNIQKPESILPTIEDSHVFILVFSKNYADSTSCLQELQYIFEHTQLFAKHVLPVFYHVDPSEVRNQTGSYGEAFAKHEIIFGHDSDKIRQWKQALTQLANHTGWVVLNMPESEVIEKIVQRIIKILNPEISSVPSDFVGMDSPIEELEKCLLLDSVDDVRAVGICGMVGIGKTTLATVLYDKISYQFEACCFIHDLSKIYEEEGPKGVQKQILHQTLGKEYNQIYNLYDKTTLVQSRLRRIRSLIIFDNVDHSEQLDKLDVYRDSLAPGSRIIVVCRDAHNLKEYGVDEVYEVPLLDETNSLQLFYRKAFISDNTMTDDHKELTFDILIYANGLPLAINMLGSSLSGQSIFEWKSALDKLGKIPDKHIMDTLQFSFDGLEESVKEIFLHISCFFNRREEFYVRNVLKCCEFDADLKLIALIYKSLISISDERKIEMHVLFEELGKKTVHENSIKNSRKWSRLWLHEQFYNVVLENMENNVKAVVLHGSEREKGKLMAEALSKMNHLRLLILKKVKFSGSLNYLSNELRYVEWDEYPFLCLPSSFQPDQLCELILVDSSIKQLWKDKKYLPNLRNLDLSYSENLTMMPDFRECLNLERLNLEGCVKLVQMDPSIGLLEKLVFLNLKNCKNLICIANEISGLTSLKYLNLCGCSKAFNNPRELKDLASCCLLPSLPSFSCLSELDISFCSLSQIPDALGCLPWLERLNLRGNNFVTLPSFRELSKLEYLNLEHCTQYKSLTELPSPAAIKQDKYKRVGMYIFNCPKLNETEHCTNMTFSWMMDFIQNQDSSASFQQIDIVIPGSEMPRWFNNRRMGRSISIDPSPSVYDNNIIGIGCCVAFSMEPLDPNTTRYEWGPVIRLGFKSSNNANSHYVVFPVTLSRHLIRVKSNHMWLIYFARHLFFSFLSFVDNSLWDLNHILMEASITNGQGLHMEVNNCGFSWVFKKDQPPLDSYQ